MTTILLTKKNGTTSEEVPFKVESINILQFQKVLKVIKDVLKEAQTDSDILNVVENLMNPKPVVAAEGQTIEEAEAEADQAFYAQIIEALELVLEVLPEKFFELVAVSSGINKDLLVQQKAEMLFEIIDAVVAANDIEALVKRAKKSLEVILKKWNFSKFVKKKAAAKNVQA